MASYSFTNIKVKLPKLQKKSMICQILDEDDDCDHDDGGVKVRPNEGLANCINEDFVGLSVGELIITALQLSFGDHHCKLDNCQFSCLK